MKKVFTLFSSIYIYPENKMEHIKLHRTHISGQQCTEWSVLKYIDDLTKELLSQWICFCNVLTTVSNRCTLAPFPGHTLGSSRRPCRRVRMTGPGVGKEPASAGGGYRACMRGKTPVSKPRPSRQRPELTSWWGQWSRSTSICDDEDYDTQ